MSVYLNRFSLYKRPTNGIYHIGYYQDGKRFWKSTGATTKPEALKALTQFKALLQERTRSVSLEQLSKEFHSYGETNYSKKTMIMASGVLTHFIGMYPKASLGEITAKHIDAFKSKRLKEISPVSVNVELRMLRSIFNTARRWKFVDRNIFEGVMLARVPDTQPVYLTKQDFEKLLAIIKEVWLKEAIVFAVSTGLRRGELVNLQWSNVDLQRKLLCVESSPTFKTKTGKTRIIPLNETALYILQSKQGKDISEYVFTLNGKKIFEGWITHLFKRYVRRANLSNQGIHLHSLRHSFATWLVQSGATLFQVQKLLGHSSSQMTEIYSHLQPESLHAEVNKISVSMN